MAEKEDVLRELHVATQELLAAESRDEIAQRAAAAADTILGHESNVVRLLSGEKFEPVAVTEQAQAAMGNRPVYDHDNDNPVANAYETGEPLVIDDLSTLDDDHNRGEANSAMYLPLGEHGVFSITATVENGFDQSDVDLASILASNTRTVLDRLANERELARKNEHLEAFVDVISHDIPNHLNAAQMWVDLGIEDGSIEDLHRVTEAHERIESVITDMKTLVEQEESVGEQEWIRLDDLATQCWNRCCPDGRLTVEADANGHIRADRSRLEQLVENLFWNACEHAGEGSTVSVGLLGDGFFIADDGPGIPEEEREDVLSAGFTTEEEDHSGFGLTIVRDVVRAHGWELAVTDSEDGGARFEITNVAVNERESVNAES